jgi:hypothetical protein
LEYFAAAGDGDGGKKQENGKANGNGTKRARVD